MVPGNAEDESPSWHRGLWDQSRALLSPRAGTKATSRTCRGWSSSACWSLPCSWGQMALLEFLLPTPAGAPQHISLPCSQQGGEVGKHQKLPKEKRPKLLFTELIRAGKGCGQPQILSLSFSQPALTRSILLHPQLGCQAVWFAHREGPGSAWAWEPLSCPTLRESDPICSGCLCAAACPSSWAFSLF